ncbi:hypothetical protein AB0G74_16810 [Streptomyces sp. NPDC020875]|uniref:hypothetical protein n=1 Tax=Streptomyces sp. NPDC020875 TaxID=3154898 RepID=UPI00340EB90B
MATNNNLDLDVTADAGTPAPKKDSPLADARVWWDTAWTTGGVLHDRWEELRLAPQLGWHHMATWIKALIAGTGIAFVMVLAADAAAALIAGTDQLLTTLASPEANSTTNDIWAAIHTPARTYLTTHTQGLPIDAPTAYALWQTAGLAGLAGGFLRITAARTLWITWGAASIAMIWQATPDTGRPVATGIAVLFWILASAAALRGLTLRPAIRRARPAQPPAHRPAPADNTSGVQAHHTR